MVYPRFFLLTIQLATTSYDNFRVLVSSLMSATLYTTVLMLPYQTRSCIWSSK